MDLDLQSLTIDRTDQQIDDTNQSIEDTLQDRPTVLLIDDNQTNLALLSKYLKGAGYRQLIARDGMTAIQKAQRYRPDIILLDIMMPGVNGFETCRRLKASSQTRDIPVIFMTALSDTKDKLRGFQVGGVDYITKPLQHEEVLARVGNHLNLRKLNQNLLSQNVHLQHMTAELQLANEALSKRNVQLEVSSEVGQQITSILDLTELLERVVALIQTKFAYYFVGVWLLNEDQSGVVLHAGQSEQLGSQSGYEIGLVQATSPIVRVVQRGKYDLIEDFAENTAYFPFETLSDARSELALPLHVGQETIGVLDIVSDQIAAFSNVDRVGLQSLADQIAIAIRNAQLYEIEQRRRSLAESVERIGRVLTGDLDMHQVPQRVLEELQRVVPYGRGSIMLQQGDELQCIAKRGYPSAKDTSELQVTIDEGGVFQRMITTAEPVLVDDVTRDPGWQQLAWLNLHHSWLGVPLITKDRVIGMISLTRPEAEAFSNEDTHSVLALAGQAAIALENAGLFDEINRFNEQLEQKVAERTEELNQANKILERLDKTKTDFINVTSHELRTPLSVIKGYSQILRIMPVNNADPEIEKLTSGIINGVERLQKIVDTMLDVVKIDSQVLQVGRDPTNIYDLFLTIKESLIPALQERQQILTLIDLETLPFIEANAILIHKAFYNIIINAIKYTPDGGHITISGRLLEDETTPPMIEVVVSDAGIGIDPEHHERIFEKFFQTGEVAFHSTGQTKFKGGGPGLGLAIVRGIIDAHHGQAWVESPGYNEVHCPGSTFYVHLPVNQPH